MSIRNWIYKTTLFGIALGSVAYAASPIQYSSTSEPRCMHRFLFASKGETQVEVRGNFTEIPWQTSVPMQKIGNTWMASVSLPSGRPIEYKFLIDGTRWVLDPALGMPLSTNPLENSVLPPLACSSFESLRASEAEGNTGPTEALNLVSYPIPPTAFLSTDFSAEVEGKRVFVEATQKVSVLRFGMKGPLKIKITSATGGLRNAKLFPQANLIDASNQDSLVIVDDRTAELSISSPNHKTLNLRNGKKLFVLADAYDPLGAEGLVKAGPDINVHERGVGLKPLNSATQAKEWDFETDSTDSLQSILNEASVTNRGVFFPAGIYNIRTLEIPSNTKIYLSAGALLRAIPDPSAFPIDAGRVESGSNEALSPDKRFLGSTMTFSRMLHLRQVQNVTIKGKGIIDSEGSFIRNMHNIVPNILRTTESKNIEISEVMLRNSAAWTLHLLASQNIKISNLKIINDRSTLNTDGIDPDMTSDVEIENSFIYTKDDAICIKATRNSELSGNSNNILVQNNVVSSVDAALKLGTESDAQLFSNISFKNNAVFDSNRALSVVVRDGALYDSIEFDGVEVGENVTHLIEQVIGRREPAEVKGNIRNLVFKNISAPFYQKPTNNWTWYAQFRGSNPQPWVDVNVFEGNDSLNKVDGLSFSNVVVRGIRLGSRQQAEAVAGLSFGPFVENLSFEPAP